MSTASTTIATNTTSDLWKRLCSMGFELSFMAQRTIPIVGFQDASAAPTMTKDYKRSTTEPQSQAQESSSSSSWSMHYMGGMDHFILALVVYSIVIHLIVLCSKLLMIMIILAMIVLGLAIRQHGADRIDYSSYLYRFGCRYMESEKVLQWMKRCSLCDDAFIHNISKKVE